MDHGTAAAKVGCDLANAVPLRSQVRDLGQVEGNGLTADSKTFGFAVGDRRILENP
jgi:hypothetical protein